MLSLYFLTSVTDIFMVAIKMKNVKVTIINQVTKLRANINVLELDKFCLIFYPLGLAM